MPVFSKITTCTALYIEISVATFSRRKSGAYTVFKPGIVKIIACFNSIRTIGHRNIITTTEFMQQIGFSIYYTFAPDFLTNIFVSYTVKSLSIVLILNTNPR